MPRPLMMHACRGFSNYIYKYLVYMLLSGLLFKPTVAFETLSKRVWRFCNVSMFKCITGGRWHEVGIILQREHVCHAQRLQGIETDLYLILTVWTNMISKPCLCNESPDVNWETYFLTDVQRMIKNPWIHVQNSIPVVSQRGDLCGLFGKDATKDIFIYLFIYFLLPG